MIPNRNSGERDVTKAEQYAQLVTQRKQCRACAGLANPAAVAAGQLDSEQIGPWSLWQGNLNASIMVVGQDWGDTSSFIRQRGREGAGNPTNQTLAQLIRIAGISSIGAPGSMSGRDVAFFTNAILCLKEGGLQAKVETAWFDNCTRFLRRQIELVHPPVVVGLGEQAYRAILASFQLTGGAFRVEVEAPEGRVLPNGSCVFAVYHCGLRILNTHRPIAMQREDWKRLRPYLNSAG